MNQYQYEEYYILREFIILYLVLLMNQRVKVYKIPFNLAIFIPPAYFPTTEIYGICLINKNEIYNGRGKFNFF